MAVPRRDAPADEVFHFERKPLRGGEKALLAAVVWILAVGGWFLVDSGWGTPEFFRVLIGTPVLALAVAAVGLVWTGWFKDLVVDARGVRVGWPARVAADRVLDWRVVTRPRHDDLLVEMLFGKIDGSRCSPVRSFIQWGDDTVMLIHRDRARIFTHVAIATNDPDAFAAALTRMRATRDPGREAPDAPRR